MAVRAVLLLVLLVPNVVTRATAVPRLVRVDGQRFIVTATNETIVMSGPNVVINPHPPHAPHSSKRVLNMHDTGGERSPLHARC